MQENHLWYDFLRTYPVRFQRQKVIAGFIVDFYCHRARLVLEIDGSQHSSEQGLSYDAERSAVLARYQLTVLRVKNAEIDHRFSSVCQQIDRIVKTKLSQ